MEADSVPPSLCPHSEKGDFSPDGWRHGRSVELGDRGLDGWRIVEAWHCERRARFLENGEGRLQSGAFLDEPLGPVFQYAKAMVSVATGSGAKRLLMLGAGGFCVPASILACGLEGQIDVVDTVSQLHEVGREWFGLPHSGRIRFFCRKAEEHLRRTEGAYDLVLVDIFNNKGLVPEEFWELETMTSLRRAISETGIVVGNSTTRKGREWEQRFSDIRRTGLETGLDFSFYVHAGQRWQSNQNVLFCHAAAGGSFLDGWSRIHMGPVFYRPKILSKTRRFRWPSDSL